MYVNIVVSADCQAQKERDLQQQKVRTIRAMYDTVHDEYEVRNNVLAGPSGFLSCRGLIWA